MGTKVTKDRFTSQDFVTFKQRLNHQLYRLKDVLNQKGFSNGDASFGAELELYLFDKSYEPSSTSEAVLKHLDPDIFTEEINQYNLEINLPPESALDTPFTKMHNSLLAHWATLANEGRKNASQLAAIGILPTLKKKHLTLAHMTKMPRYSALNNELSKHHAHSFKVDINAIESLKFDSNEVTLEGANTSFQVHFKVPGDDFVNLYNAAQLTTPLVLAASANSPFMLGKKLWHETRIALFKQSIDNRVKALKNWRQPARVNFGHGWLRENAWELFAESVSLYPPLLPVVDEDDKPYAELMLHHGTIWTWNRAVFDASGKGHLRIEYRSLPAGPTAVDMLANAAFAIGLTKGLSESVNEYMVKLPFQYAEYNFYRAAKKGLDADIVWPSIQQHELEEKPIKHLILQMIPIAFEGLVSLGVNKDEASYYLNIIEQRVIRMQNGAYWQLNQLDTLEKKGLGREHALASMMEAYLSNMRADTPVSEWKYNPP
ncbi:MAG: glutamate-cysteine ligase family protein [Pseudomonadota bacterium]